LLGVPQGTLSSRLARGRDVLRRRLARRGWTPSALALGTALTAGAAATVPAALIVTTTRAVTTGAADASAAALAQEVLRAMFLAKCKSALLAAVGAAVVMGLFVGLALAVGGGKGPKSDKERLQGAWNLVSAEMGGKKADDDEFARMKEKPLV